MFTKILSKNWVIINQFLSQQKFQRYEQLYNDVKIKKLVEIMRRKLPSKEKYFKRLTKELLLIQDFGFEEVFYQVNEILEITGDMLHIIRGSAGSCLLCFLMGITSINPVKEGIALSRFMHKTRPSIPDIDIDLPADQREEIYEKIFKKWESRVARISNHIVYRENSAYREAIRRAGYRKFVPREYELDEIFDDKKVIKKVVKEANELIGKFRCYSLHCGGIVIFPSKIPQELFLQEFDIKKNGKIKGQQIKLNKDETENSGLIKIDVLSNRGLSQLKNISKKPLTKYPLDDDDVIALFERGENIGLTHSESRAMMKVFRTMKPKTIKELAIGLALIRPAAAKGYRKSEFLKDYRPYKYESGKYIIFDDDATMFIKKLLKCDDSTADNYRRAFSKGKHNLKRRFKEQLKKLNLDPKYRNDILDRLEQLQYYSFCKSHAYSYAQLVWALGYHKIRNPKKFWTSTINNCNTSYRKWVHYREAVKAGLSLKLGKKPFKLQDNTLVPVKPLKEKDQLTDSIQQLLKFGYWTDSNFLNGMHYDEYWTKITKKHKNFKGTIRNEGKMKYAKFKGLIATGRGYKREEGGYLTFITIGIDNGMYHDLILYGYHKVTKMMAISGYGKVKTDGICKWVEVQKFQSVWLS